MALRSGAEVIDASATVRAIHQNPRLRLPSAWRGGGVFHGAEAGRNYQLVGGWKHLRTIAAATRRLRSAMGLRTAETRRRGSDE